MYVMEAEFKAQIEARFNKMIDDALTYSASGGHE